MAESISKANYDPPADSHHVTHHFSENISEEGEDDAADEHLTLSSYPAVPQPPPPQQQHPSILYKYNNGYQHLSPPVSSASHPAQFDLPMDDDEADSEEISALMSNLTPPTPVLIQRVSSEDEIDLYSKRKRAKFVGPYLFGDVIGQGSYAKVKECLDRRSLCRRAVKIMQRRRLRKTPMGEQMAATEIRLLKKLNHPNVIRLYDFIRNDEKQKLYLFIDLCVVSLQEMLDTIEPKHALNAFPTWQAHGYFVQLVQGMEYLHSKFIIHNDIKPGNLLITVDHQLKITDFGTAEQLDMFSPDDTIKRSQGTPAFQCPEIANGEDTYHGFSVDVWSCGVTLYNLVTGTLPFDADNVYLLIQTVGRGNYKIPDDVDPHLSSLLHGLLHRDKTARFSIEQIKHHDWFRRRPPRTFDMIRFPPLALNRFQTCTMHDFLAELHQSSTENSEDHQPQPDIQRPDGSMSVLISSSNDQRARTIQDRPRRHARRSLLNCTCSRTNSGDNLHQAHHRTCALS